jgi:hypothetical protein
MRLAEGHIAEGVMSATPLDAAVATGEIALLLGQPVELLLALGVGVWGGTA